MQLMLVYFEHVEHFDFVAVVSVVVAAVAVVVAVVVADIQQTTTKPLSEDFFRYEHDILECSWHQKKSKKIFKSLKFSEI